MQLKMMTKIRSLKFIRHSGLFCLTVSMFVTLFIFPGCKESEPTSASVLSWEFQSQRPEIAPAYRIDDKIRFNGESTLVLSGNDKSYSNGCWSLSVEVTPGSYYEFEAHFLPEDVALINRSLLARIVWLDSASSRTGMPEYPATIREETVEGWRTIRQAYRVPENTSTAKLELVLRWDAKGSVHYSQATLKEVRGIKQRLVKLATIQYRPQSTSSSQENLALFAGFIKIAAEKSADIVCLPEAITLVGTDKSYGEVSEPVPGLSTEFLGNLARQNRIYIVAGILEQDGPVIYNTAVLLDRDGNLAGKYRKVSLPREEIEGGVTPGYSYPVFDTDFGRIGMMICWDLQFPEVARELALQGAEVIFMPIWGGNLTLARARAIENQIYLVSSSYDMKTGVFDLEGALIAEASEEDPVVVVEVDLNKHKYWPFLGDLKNRIPREKPEPQTKFR